MNSHSANFPISKICIQNKAFEIKSKNNPCMLKKSSAHLAFEIISFNVCGLCYFIALITANAPGDTSDYVITQPDYPTSKKHLMFHLCVFSLKS